MTALAAVNPETTPSSSSTGGRLSTADGRELPLRSTALEADAKGGIARVVLRQRFVNPHEVALHVTYLLPLPSDGAVAGFAFVIDGRRVVGEVDRKQAARERFEQALVEGRTAALLEQERSSLFTQEVGNIPPRAEVEVEIEIDQRLRWLDEGAWEWRFPTVVGPRYMGAPGRVEDAARITVDVAERGVSARVSMALRIGDEVVAKKPIESPSHAIVIDQGTTSRVTFADGAALDRDVVVRWPVSAPKVGASLAMHRPASPKHEDAAYGLLTLVPPSEPMPAVARDLIFLIDVSGSMGGTPLDQLKRVAAAMIDTLGDTDRIELIAFGNEPVRFTKEPIAATREGKKSALAWLRALQSSGGTEMRKAVIEALRPLRAGTQRQVVLMTDGYIGFEREIVREVRERLPQGARLHTVGVGSAVNRTLTQWAARAGSGVELVVGIGEDPERVAQRLLARTTAPLVTELSIEGDALRETAPARVPDLYAGAPSLVSLALSPKGGTLTVRGRTARGSFEERVTVPALALGEGLPAVATLFGRERVEDLETEAAAGADLDGTIERIGLTFQIATRLTSWITVSQDVTVDVSEPSRKVTQPHEVPHGVSVEGLGLRAPSLAGPPLALMSLEEAEEASAMAWGAPPASAPYPSAPPASYSFPSAPSGAPGGSPFPPPSPSYIPEQAKRSMAEPHGYIPPLPRKRSRRSFVWILLALLVLIAAAVGAYVVLSSDAPAEPAQQSQEPPARE